MTARWWVMMAALLLGGCRPWGNEAVFERDYRITLYGDDGKVLREWCTHSNLSSGLTGVSFWHDGRRVTVRGTFTIEEQ